MTIARPAIDRFMAFVVPEPNSGCWLWMGALFKGKQYGMFCVSRNRRTVQVHRWSYEYHHGPIPRGHVIDHKCRVKGCVNPDHLRAVTPRTNVRENNDSVCTKNAAKTHCKRGHPFDKKNTVLIKDGRDCRACRRLRRKAHYLKGRIDVGLSS